MNFKIIIHKTHHKVKRINTRFNSDIRTQLFSLLESNGIDIVTADEAATWCSDAPASESYNTDDLDIYIMED